MESFSKRKINPSWPRYDENTTKIRSFWKFFVINRLNEVEYYLDYWPELILRCNLRLIKKIFKCFQIFGKNAENFSKSPFFERFFIVLVECWSNTYKMILTTPFGIIPIKSFLFRQLLPLDKQTIIWPEPYYYFRKTETLFVFRDFILENRF